MRTPNIVRGIFRRQMPHDYRAIPFPVVCNVLTRTDIYCHHNSVAARLCRSVFRSVASFSVDHRRMPMRLRPAGVSVRIKLWIMMSRMLNTHSHRMAVFTAYESAWVG